MFSLWQLTADNNAPINIPIYRIDSCSMSAKAARRDTLSYIPDEDCLIPAHTRETAVVASDCDV